MRIATFGTPDSIYTRIVRLILACKTLRYDLVMADVFEDRGLPESYELRHPFRRIPSIEIDGVCLYETDAIAHYRMRAFPKALCPENGDSLRMAR